MRRLCSRYLLPCILLMPLTAAPCALAGETWELGDKGWSALSKPDPTTPRGQLQLLQRELVLIQTQTPVSVTAVNALLEKVELWLKANPRHELEAQGRLLHGDTLCAKRFFYYALYDYEFVARNFTATPTFTVALERERRLAEIYFGGWKRKFLGMRIIPMTEEAVELLVRIQERVPGSAMGEEASLRLGDWYFEIAQMDMAVEAYSIFLQNYPSSVHESFVLRRIIEASLARFNGPKFDSTGLIEARQRIYEYQKKYPLDAQKLGTEALLTRIEESLSLRDYHSAHWYEARGEKVSAGVLYRRLIVLHPNTQAAHDATERLNTLGEPLVDARDPALQIPEQERVQ